MLPSARGNDDSIREMTAQVVAATSAEKAKLQGVANVVETENGAEIYVHGRLEDTVHWAADGTATHSFANGQTVKVGTPARKTMLQRPLPTCQDLLLLIQADQTKLNWDTAAVILALGAGAAAAFFSAGFLGVPAALVNTAVLAAWVAQKTALDSAELAYATAGC